PSSGLIGPRPSSRDKDQARSPSYSAEGGLMPVNKKKPNDLSAMIDGVISIAKTSKDREKKIVDVITFCEDPRFRNFKGQDPPLERWCMQKIVLKLIYAGTRGNENLALTEAEEALLRKIHEEEDLDYSAEYGGFGQILDKFRRRPGFTKIL